MFKRKNKNCAVGKGDLTIRECLRLLAEMGYDGYLAVEHFGHPKMKEAIRDSAMFLDNVAKLEAF